MENLLFDKFPELLDEVEIGRIRREEEQLDVKPLGSLQHQATTLVARVVENNHNAAVIVTQCKLAGTTHKLALRPRRGLRSS